MNRQRPWQALAAIGAATAAAHIGNNFPPYLVGGLIDRYHFGPAQMGVFAMTETLAYAAAMFGVAPRAGAHSPRGLALAASALVVVAQAGSAGASSFAALLLGRVAAGLGFGLMNSAVNLAAGHHDHPARAISTGIALQTLLYALVNIGLPMVGAAHGVGGMFGALGALSALLGLGAMALPNTPSPAHGQAQKTPFPREGWWVLAAMALFSAGSLAIWPFMERAAHAIGLSATQFGRYQSLATLLSAGGNALLALLVGRMARRWALAGALVACGLACAGLTTLALPDAFAAALVVYNVSWFLAYPLLLGLAYAADSTGRLAVMTTATWLLAESAAAGGAGSIAQLAGSYALIGPLGLAGCAGALLVAWPLARRADNAPR